MKKVFTFFKCFGLKETVKKIFRYLNFKNRIKFNKDNYISIVNKENKYVFEKLYSISIEGLSNQIDNVLEFIDVCNMVGLKVYYVATDNLYCSKKIYDIYGYFIKCKFNIKTDFKVNVDDILSIDKSIDEVSYYEKLFSIIDSKIDLKYDTGEMVLKFPKLSIVILNYNNKNIIFKCLDNLIKFNKKYNYEVLVVDNGSTDGSYELLKKYKGIKLFQNNKNGCSSGRNIGINYSTGDYILFLDSDQIVLGFNWLFAYLTIINYNSNITIGWAAGFFDKNGYAGKTVDFYENKYMPSYGLYRTDIGYIGTGGMIVNKKVILETDLFDEMYDPTCYEDTDISLQIKNLGYEVVYCKALGIIHKAHQTTNSGSEEHSVLIRNKGDYFVNKWKKKNTKLLRFIK